MKAPISSLTGSALGTDRVAAASRQRQPRIETPANQEAPILQSSAFKREVPMPQNADFVEIDGRKYFLDAPRGTYLDILV